jgi:hypothetical protein
MPAPDGQGSSICASAIGATSAGGSGRHEPPCPFCHDIRKLDDQRLPFLVDWNDLPCRDRLCQHVEVFDRVDENDSRPLDRFGGERLNCGEGTAFG